MNPVYVSMKAMAGYSEIKKKTAVSELITGSIGFASKEVMSGSV